MGVRAFSPEVGRDPKSLAERLLDLLDHVDYRVAVSDADREEIFRLRYDAYRREEAIAPRFDRRLSDRYDDLDSTTIVGMYIDGELASTIRATVVTRDFPECPANEVFADVLAPYLEAGKVLIDPTRHATKEKFFRLYPGMMPYLTIRAPWMIAEYHHADAILAWVRPEHRAFYRRTFGSQQIGEPRQFPTLLRPQCLTYGEYRLVRDDVQRRFPSFRSSAFERRMLVEAQGISAPLAPMERHAFVPANDVPAAAHV